MDQEVRASLITISQRLTKLEQGRDSLRASIELLTKRQDVVAAEFSKLKEVLRTVTGRNLK